MSDFLGNMMGSPEEGNAMAERMAMRLGAKTNEEDEEVEEDEDVEEEEVEEEEEGEGEDEQEEEAEEAATEDEEPEGEEEASLCEMEVEGEEDEEGEESEESEEGEDEEEGENEDSGGEGAKQPKSKKRKNEEQLVVAAKSTEATAGQIRNSVTCKKDWDAFDRSAKSKAFPVELHGQFKKQKLSLFGLWLDCGKKWDKVLLQVQQEQESVNLSRAQWMAAQAKDLKAKLPKEKFEELGKKRLEAGLYYEDKDFPDDPEDCVGRHAKVCFSVAGTRVAKQEGYIIGQGKHMCSSLILLVCI